MEAMLKHVIKADESLMKILGKFVIVFVPMINPDGVVIGNSRCSLMGVDLNRRWTNPNKMIHPDIYFLKE